jgi:hypothetical protein
MNFGKRSPGARARAAGQGQRVGMVADVQIAARDAPARQVELDLVDQGRDLGSAELPFGRVRTPGRGQLLDRVAPVFDQGVLDWGARDGAAIADLTALLQLLSGAGEIAAHRERRPRRALWPAAQGQAVNPAGVRVIGLALQLRSLGMGER